MTATDGENAAKGRDAGAVHAAKISARFFRHHSTTMLLIDGWPARSGVLNSYELFRMPPSHLMQFRQMKGFQYTKDLVLSNKLLI